MSSCYGLKYVRRRLKASKKFLIFPVQGLRWIALILLLLAVVNNGMKWQSGKTFTDKDRKLNLFTMIFFYDAAYDLDDCSDYFGYGW